MNNDRIRTPEEMEINRVRAPEEQKSWLAYKAQKAMQEICSHLRQVVDCYGFYHPGVYPFEVMLHCANCNYDIYYNWEEWKKIRNTKTIEFTSDMDNSEHFEALFTAEDWRDPSMGPQWVKFDDMGYRRKEVLE
jgi:hypothetical protein